MKEKASIASQYGPGFVYFVQEDGDGPIKIGRAKNPGPRISSLASGNPHQLNVLLLVPGEHRESLFHRYFARSHIRGEWFRPDTYLLAHIRALREEIIGTTTVLGSTVKVVKPPDFGGLPIEEMKLPQKAKRKRKGDYAIMEDFFRDRKTKSDYEGPGKHRLANGAVVF